MNRLAKTGLWIGALLSAGCSSKLVVSEHAGGAIECHQDRAVRYVVHPGKFTGMYGVRTDGVGGYYLVDGVSFSASVTGVDRYGTKTGEFALQSNLGPTPFDVVPNPGGGAIVCGTVDDFSGPVPWIGKVDANWDLSWERSLKSPIIQRPELARLSDGTLIVAGLSGDPNSEPTAVSWARISETGAVLWTQSVSLQGLSSSYRWWGRMLSTTASDGVRIVAVTSHGVTLIKGNIDGGATYQVLATTLTGVVASSVLLPDGRLALASTRSSGAVLTMLGPDETVQWEKLYAQGQDAEAYTVAFNAARNELLLGGSYRGNDHGTQRTWMVATDLDGNQTWQLVRAPIGMDIDGNVSAASDTTGPPITDIAPQPDGSFLATGETTNLSYFVVGAEPCGG